MVNHISNCSLLFVMLALTITGLIEVKGNTCSQPLGGCGPMGQCDQRCKALHIDGQGSCDLGLCTCYYGCADPPPSPTPPKMCNNGLGVCSVQCGDACWQKEEEGDLGSCDSIRDFDSPMPNINGQPNRNCTAYIGDRGPLCTDSCCNSKCTKQFNQGVGVCDVFGVSNNACVCHYVC
ncbi:Defensin-like protein 183 [Glycine max]|nr:Defensin-like protein 183 [Glycine max]